MFVYSGFFFFKQKTAYDMRISDWSSDVCSSDLSFGRRGFLPSVGAPVERPRQMAEPQLQELPRRRSGRRPRRPFAPGVPGAAPDRKRVGEGKSVAVRVELDGGRIITKKYKQQHKYHEEQ